MLIERPLLLIVAFVPRSGSNYLCDMLRRTGLAGPLEYYYPFEFSKRQEYWHNSDGDQIDKLIIDDQHKWFDYVVERGAVKVTWQSYQIMLHEAGSLFDRVDAKYIYLRRHDKLRQAISWVRAMQSGRWTSLNEPHSSCVYNHKIIQRKLMDIIDQEARWNKLFERVPHLQLFYEDINYDTVIRVEELLGIKRTNDYWDTPKNIMTQYEILRDDETEKWVDMFIGS